ncbi:hypothetical protein L249_0322 [Ophiocordyceps polyrhachis-furcata BCC 54312]|uniref:Uncharacterized protein n=1 Tax=Ophiocordyceps polyrhachis-furcata BCC 54312 TaxID=1330021 RepID=A0A367LFY5_9HYPO|nr:hypothetical protein L249_0322 [Ophiocordyceps polyrhachis-furcata BCC 54312]
MATSMGPNFTGHPAGMPHQAVAGHPMGPGMPPNAAQQGGPGGGMPQQFGGGHMGPGGQVNPALMAGLPPGVNPHALQHLTPAQQQHLFQQQQHHHQQQQQHMQNQYHNPSAIAAMRQHQLLQHQQQQARQALLTQQGMHNIGVANGLPMGMQLSHQQMQQLRNAGRLGQVSFFSCHVIMLILGDELTVKRQHPQAQAVMAQQIALQQAQQAAAHSQGMPGGPAQGQHMQMSAPSMAAVQQQSQNHMGGGGQNQMGGQQQPGGQQTPCHPQSQPGQPQQPGQQPQQTPQQGSQAGTPAPSGQQTPSQTPAPTPGQLQPGQGQGQPQQMHHQAPPHMAAAHQLAMTSSFLQQQRRDGSKSQCLLKLLQFSEHLSGYPGAKAKDDLSYWNMFVARFFSPSGVFRHSLYISDAKEPMDKQYEIAYPAIARYFHTHFGSGVKSMQLFMDRGVTDRPLPGDCHCIENARSSIVYWYETGSHLVATGTLRVHFDAEQRIELFEFLTTGHEEYISRKKVIDAAKPAHMWLKEWHTVNSQDAKQSPEMSKKSKAKALRSPQTQPPEVLVNLPDCAVNGKGVTEAVHQFLEIVEVISQMTPLIGFCHSNPGVGPYAALDQYVSTYISGGPPAMNGHVPPQQGPRTPSFGPFAIGASPATVHMNLPGSPHMGSPAPGHMQAPGMQLQASQQGTSSSGPSANTSPASNKRRRPSGIKEEEGSGAPAPAPQVNGAPNRSNKPPTPRMPKRVKGNPM